MSQRVSQRVRRRAYWGLGSLAIVATAYLLAWPVPIEPRVWNAPTAPGYTGAHAPNTRLSALQHMAIGAEYGPEHLAIGPDGLLYAAMTSGALLRMAPDGSHQEVFANTDGRVLGFSFDAAGRMIAADAMRGILAIDSSGRVSMLTDRVSDGDRISYANSLVVAANGLIYFTDASQRFAPRDWGGTYEASLLDILEQAATGRVLVHDPKTARTEVVAEGFSFANGLALSADEKTLYVAETGRYRIWSVRSEARAIDVRRPTDGAHVFLDNLPGYPDNLMRGRDGRIWVGLFRPRNPAADNAATRPFVRRILVRLPRALLPVGAPYSHIFAFNEQGQIVEDLQDPLGRYPETTGATETADRLYVHSLHAPSIGWLPR